MECFSSLFKYKKESTKIKREEKKKLMEFSFLLIFYSLMTHPSIYLSLFGSITLMKLFLEAHCCHSFKPCSLSHNLPLYRLFLLVTFIDLFCSPSFGSPISHECPPLLPPPPPFSHLFQKIPKIFLERMATGLPWGEVIEVRLIHKKLHAHIFSRLKDKRST